MRKCPPGTCSANASNVKFGNISLHWRGFKCIIFWKNIHDILLSMISKYKWCSNIHYLRITMMTEYPRCLNISVRPNLISVTFLPKISAENPFCFGRNHFAKATEPSDSAEPGSFCRIIHFRQKIAVSAEYSSFCRHYLKVLESNRPFCCKIS